ncbi:MAG TPA: tetratricopeptide repeat protein, partial [Candidatus Acidoferrum sp.]|nr:tetratricopeptide repeat protein [Candidatus Acidoferrum sp.]
LVALARDRERPGDAAELAPAARNAIRRAGNEPRFRATVERALAGAAMVTGDLAGARAHIKSALALLAAERYPQERADVLFTMSNLNKDETRYPEALFALAEARALYEKEFGPESKQIADVDYSRSVLLVRLRRCDEAVTAGESAIAMGMRMTGAEDAELYLDHMNLGRAHACRKDAVAARASFARALAIAEKAGPESLRLANAEIEFGQALVLLERHREALVHLRRGLVIAEKKNDIVIVGMALCGIGQAEHELGQFRRAEGWLKRAVEHYERHDIKADLAETLTHLAKTELALGRPGRARAACDRSLAIYVEAKISPAEVHAVCESVAR